MTYKIWTKKVFVGLFFSSSIGVAVECIPRKVFLASTVAIYLSLLSQLKRVLSWCFRHCFEITVELHAAHCTKRPLLEMGVGGEGVARMRAYVFARSLTSRHMRSSTYIKLHVTKVKVVNDFFKKGQWTLSYGCWFKKYIN